MRLPRLSLGSGGRRVILLYVPYTLALFAIFLVHTFPHKILVERALEAVNTGDIAVKVKDAGFAWYKGYALDDIRIVPARGTDGVPFLEAQRLFVRPTLRQLLRGNFHSLSVDADLYGGNAQAEVSLTGGTLAGTVDLQGLRLGLYERLSDILQEGEVTGRLGATIAFEATGASYATRQSVGEIHARGPGIHDAKISGFKFPDLQFSEADVKFTVRNERLEVEDFSATGDELNVNASGQIILRDPIENSVLNLKATLQPGLAASDAIKGLIALIPRDRGGAPDAPFTISGTLARPRIR